MFGNEQDVLRQIEAYTRARGMAESTFGRLAVNDGKLVESLRQGRTVTLRTVRKIQDFILENPAPPTHAAPQPERAA